MDQQGGGSGNLAPLGRLNAGQWHPSVRPWNFLHGSLAEKHGEEAEPGGIATLLVIFWGQCVHGARVCLYALGMGVCVGYCMRRLGLVLFSFSPIRPS